MLKYRVFLSIVFLPIVFMLILRFVRGSECWTHFKQRLGWDVVRTQDGVSVCWLHAASNGELKSAVPVMENLIEGYPGKAFLVTCNTISGVSLARDLGFTAQLAPLDYRWVLKRFYRQHRISGHILMESEIWPNRIELLYASTTPVLVLGARMSATSARLWAYFKTLANMTLQKISFLSAQDQISLDRFKTLGLTASSTGHILNLKSLFRASRPSQSRTERANMCVAVSTHFGEDEIILDAFIIAKKTWPDLRFIIAPRHPERSRRISALIKNRGLSFVTRSSGEPFFCKQHDILLADSLGEMDLWYSQSGTCIIGGTFANYGGHTPYEPAAYDCAILHGTYIDNFRHEFSQLVTSKTTVACMQAEQLATNLLAMKPPLVQETHAKSVKKILSSVNHFEQVMNDISAILTSER